MTRPPFNCVAAAFLLLACVERSDAGEVSFERKEGSVGIRIGRETVATYVYKDPVIRRPFFANVKAPGGIPVTRPHPPGKDDGPADHADMHPGIWLAFGDLSGADFWRNKGEVIVERFPDEPEGGPDGGTFSVESRYVAGGRTVCRETTRYTILTRSDGYLIEIDSIFHAAAADFYFGDQEEMGLGVRLAKSLAVKGGGRIVDADARANEAGVWGKQSDGCLAGGEAGGKRVGVVVTPHRENFRRSWFHARDYGLVVANPFGRKAFTRGEESRVTVRKGESLRLRFGVFVYGAETGREIDPAAELRKFGTASDAPNAAEGTTPRE